MIDLKDLLFIPQKNVETKAPELEDLLTAIPETPKETYDLKFNAEKSAWVLKRSFLKEQSEQTGWTASLNKNTNIVFFIQTSNHDLEALTPKFLKGEKPSNTFKSNYFNMLILKAFGKMEAGLYLEKVEFPVEGINAYALVLQKEKPSVESCEEDKEEALFHFIPVDTEQV